MLYKYHALFKFFLAVVTLFVAHIPAYSYVSYNMIENSGYKITPINIGIVNFNNLIPYPYNILIFLLICAGIFLQTSKKSYSICRKILDVIISMLIMVTAFPIMAFIAILIKLDSPGPVFYKQQRVGMNHRRDNNGRWRLRERRHTNNLGQLFTIYKLRTMHVNAEIFTGPKWAQVNDARITRVGKFLRKTHLDELPQFFNILKGEMSLIGPRPERPEFIKLLNENILYYYRRYSIKPGLTGLAQVRYHYTSSLTDTRNKIKYDLLYLKNWCFFMDVKIFFHTFSAVLFGKGAR